MTDIRNVTVCRHCETSLDAVSSDGEKPVTVVKMSCSSCEKTERQPVLVIDYGGAMFETLGHPVGETCSHCSRTADVVVVSSDDKLARYACSKHVRAHHASMIHDREYGWISSDTDDT